MESKQLECRALQEHLKEKSELISTLKNPNGISEIKTMLDEFGDSIDILNNEKNVQYQQMKKALGILKRYPPSDEGFKSPKKNRSGRIQLPVIRESVQKKILEPSSKAISNVAESVDKEEDLSFTEQLQRSKQETNYLFHVH